MLSKTQNRKTESKKVMIREDFLHTRPPFCAILTSLTITFLSFSTTRKTPNRIVNSPKVALLQSNGGTFGTQRSHFQSATEPVLKPKSATFAA